MASHLARTALILAATLAPASDPRSIREALGMVTKGANLAERPIPSLRVKS
jgi:hypothetical protein